MIRIITSEKNRYPCYHGYDNKDIKNYTTLKPNTSHGTLCFQFEYHLKLHYSQTSNFERKRYYLAPHN